MSLSARIRRTPSWWIPVALVVIVCVAIVVQILLRGPEVTGSSATRTASHSYQSGPESFVQQLRAGRVDAVVISEASRKIDVTTKGPVVEHYRVDYPSLDQMVELLGRRAGLAVTIKLPPWWVDLLVLLLPVIVGAIIGGALGYAFGQRRGRRKANAAAAAAE